MKDRVGTEQRIIEAYLEVVAKEGVGAVTLQRLSKQAEVSVGGIQYYFMAPGKSDLAEAAALHVVRKGQELVERHLERGRKSGVAFDSVRAYVEGTFAWLRERSDHGPFLLHFYHLEAAGFPAKRRIRARDMWTTGRERLESLIHEAVGRGHYPAPRDAAASARQIHALLVGACLVAGVDRRDLKGWKSAERDVLAATEALLRSASVRR